MIDMDALLAPVSDDNPTGEDLRYADAYDAIRDARREDDATTSQGIWVSDLKKADWNEVLEQGSLLLQTRSKDLQVAAWVVEAMFSLEGTVGFADGLHMLASLCDRYWSDLHPSIEDGDLETRLAPFYWLDERMAQRIATLPLTAPVKDRPQGYSYQLWIQAQRLEPLATANPREFKAAIARGDVSVALFKTAIGASPNDLYVDWLADLQTCSDALGTLRDTLNDKCGGDAPSLSKLTGCIGDLTQFVRQVLTERGLLAQSGGAGGEGELAQSQEAAGVPGVAAAELWPISSRQEAYALLSHAANYLMVSEPHSPTPYLVKRAITWGKMPLRDLLGELIEEQGDRSKVFKLLNLSD